MFDEIEKTLRAKVLLEQTIKLFVILGITFIFEVMITRGMLHASNMVITSPILIISALVVSIAFGILYRYRVPIIVNQFIFVMYCIMIYYSTCLVDFIVMFLCIISVLETFIEFIPLRNEYDKSNLGKK